MFGRLARRTAVRWVPFLKWLALAEIAVLAKRHFEHLDATERRRLSALLRRGRNMTPEEREELKGFVTKMEPRAFVGGAADRLSPVPLPKRFSKSRY